MQWDFTSLLIHMNAIRVFNERDKDNLGIKIFIKDIYDEGGASITGS